MQLDTGVPGHRLGVDGQPRGSLRGEDVLVVQVDVEQGGVAVLVAGQLVDQAGDPGDEPPGQIGPGREPGEVVGGEVAEPADRRRSGDVQLSKDFADDLAGRVDVEDPKVTVGVEAFQQQGAAARVCLLYTSPLAFR